MMKPPEDGMNDRVPVSNGSGNGREAQAHLEGAFTFSAQSPQVASMLQRRQEYVDATSERIELQLTPEHERLIHDKTLYLIPARNEERRIGSVLKYLIDMHRIPLDRILVMSASTDRTDDIARSAGVDVRQQGDVLDDALHMDRFLEFQQANSLKQLAGKGITLTAGLLHLMASGKLNRRNAKDLHVTMLDSDPRYGADNGYDPVGHFAELRMHGGESMKPAKNGRARNNQPVYVAANALASYDTDYARSIGTYMGAEQWLLSGEMSRAGRASQDLVMSTGYPVETTMNISDHDLMLDFKQYADHQRRGDVDNDLEKETVMYTYILRTILAVLRQEEQTRRKLVECGLVDLRAINRRIQGADGSGMPMPIYVRDERSDVPNPVRVVLPEYPRVIGSIALLARNGIARVETW
ncbi:MAG: hypothetical protein G01um101425_470 [Candidatus Peregrinibacteria bacterium Gr01-1014_25]|nr:MAG: hypothetical protein G01um101425_470 [Candidatus Peregrinibacteria bacterium Gr01-1014_25]